MIHEKFGCDKSKIAKVFLCNKKKSSHYLHPMDLRSKYENGETVSCAEECMNSKCLKYEELKEMKNI